MPRIRTLKPEHRQHRKIGPLPHFHYRLWVGMICEADDEGRLVYAPDQLRILIFPYHSGIKAKAVEGAIADLEERGLIRVYEVAGSKYVDFPSWRDHQRINRPVASKLPSYQRSRNGHGDHTENSLTTHGELTGDRRGKEGKGSEGKGGECEGRETRTVARATDPKPLHEHLADIADRHPELRDPPA